MFGFQIQASDFEAIGEEAFVPPTDTFSPGVFLFEELELSEAWKLQAGARFDHVNYDATGFSSEDFNPWGFSLGTLWGT